MTLIEEKKRQIDQQQPLPLELTQNLLEWFKIELTYTSNAIEGNTLSRAETALIVEKGLTVGSKTLQEHLEAINHASAFDWISRLATSAETSIDEKLILNLHQLILQKIDDINAGRYRTVPVRIAGSTAIMPNALKVPELMEQFVLWLQQTQDKPLLVAIDAHYKLVSIHPFVDGNGRTARLLMNLLLMRSGYPPAIISKEDRAIYLAGIEKGQITSSLDDYYDFMLKAVDHSLDIFAGRHQDQARSVKLINQELLKIGDVASLAGETTSTIRHWTKMGLLPVAHYSPGGYQLYYPKVIDLIKKIRQLQINQRLTLLEIKAKL